MSTRLLVGVVVAGDPGAGFVPAIPGTRDRGRAGGSSGRSAHQGFDGVGVEGDVGHQVDGSLVGDEDVVFEADAEAFLAEVQAGFDRHDPAGGDGFGS